MPPHRAHRFPWRRGGGVALHPPETFSAVPAENEKEADLTSLLLTLFLGYHPETTCIECQNRAKTAWRHPVA